MKKLLTFSILVILFASCNGQVSHKTDKREAPHQLATVSAGDTVAAISNDIWVVFQDKANNYWFGSDTHGLYRYDGNTLIHFSAKDGLCNNRIREIKDDKEGNVYIATLDGVCKYDGNSFTSLPIALGKDAAQKWMMKPDDLWFKGKSSKLCRYDGDSLYYLKLPKHYLEDEYYKKYPNARIEPYEIYYTYKDSKGNIWFGTGSMGLYRYDGKSFSWLYEEHLTQTKEGGSFGIRSIMEDKNGKFWFCNTKYRYNILAGELPNKGPNFINYTTEKGIDVKNDPMGGDRMYFQTIVEDGNGDLWMQTYRDGIWKYDSRTLTKYPVMDGTEVVNTISLYQDKSGNLWLGTQDKGVYKFDGKEFKKFKI